MKLDRRALNRALLDRQLLLRRAKLPVAEAVRHLAGLQAQTPHTWYVGLWARLEDFDPGEVVRLIEARRLVRIVLMRSTIHLAGADDARWLRPAVQQATDRGFQSNWGRKLSGVDAGELAGLTRRLLDGQALASAALGRALQERWPDSPADALAQAARCWVPLVQVPPRGLWGRSGGTAYAPLDTWTATTGKELAGEAPAGGSTILPDDSGGGAAQVEELVLRYLAAFGPATVADVQTWSGLTRLREIVDRLRPGLMVLTGPDGEELYDLPDAPRPPAGTPAPPRLLYDFDNLLLSHADRSRVVTEEHTAAFRSRNGVVPQPVLVDGFTAGTWEVDGAVVNGKGATGDETVRLTVRTYEPLSGPDAEAVTAEGAGLLGLIAPGSPHDVIVTTR